MPRNGSIRFAANRKCRKTIYRETTRNAARPLPPCRKRSPFRQGRPRPARGRPTTAGNGAPEAQSVWLKNPENDRRHRPRATGLGRRPGPGRAGGGNAHLRCPGALRQPVIAGCGKRSTCETAKYAGRIMTSPDGSSRVYDQHGKYLGRTADGQPPRTVKSSSTSEVEEGASASATPFFISSRRAKIQTAP